METYDFEASRKRVEKIYEIKRRLLKSKESKEDMRLLNEFADSGDSPLAEYLFGACLYFGEGVETNLPKSFDYLQRCQKHASGDIQMQMMKIYIDAGELYRERAVDCVVAAAKDFHPEAMKMVRRAKREAVLEWALHFFRDNTKKTR